MKTKKETKKTAKKKGDSKVIAPAAEVNKDDIADEICDFNMSDDDEEEMQNGNFDDEDLNSEESDDAESDE